MNLSEFLHTAPEFSDMSAGDIASLEKAMMVRDYPDGHVFFSEGSSPDALYLIIDGEVAVSHLKGEERGYVVIKRMHAGEFFGLMALIDHTRRHASCTAVGKVRVASLPSNAFALLYESNSRLSNRFQLIIARQLARDFRSLVSVLRQNIFALDDEPVNTMAYQGPERRSGTDRRNHSDRRKG
jgi:CRP-like cAMP-binding protein